MTAADLEREQDFKRLRLMEIDYHRACVDFPYIKRVLLARNAGARAFDIELSDLLSPSRKSIVARPRLKMMAAITVLLPCAPLHSISKAFGDRDRTCVLNAIAQYGRYVRQAMRGVVA
jgi:hypothetical protein